MARTVRKDRNDKTYTEGRYLDHNVYKCKCEYCTTRRQERKERIADKEMKDDISDHYFED